MSDRAAAALVSSVGLLEHIGVIQSRDMSMVVDRSKIRRERNKARKECVEKA